MRGIQWRSDYDGVLMTYLSTNRRARWLQLVDEDGNLDRPLLADEWTTPGACLDLVDGTLVPDSSRFMETLKDVEASPGLLEQFVELSEVAGDPGPAVLNYARRWGLLDLCQHQLPIDHGPWQLPLSLAATNITDLPSDDCHSLRGKEPVATWLYWSRQAAALLRIFARLQDSQPGLPGDWVMLAELGPWVEPKMLERKQELELADATVDLLKRGWGAVTRRGAATRGRDRDGVLKLHREHASAAVEAWLRFAGVELELRWPQVNPQVGFRGGQLAGALGLRIVLAAADSAGWAVCPQCGRQHSPKRAKGRPREYCEGCRAAGAPAKRAQKTYRQTSKYKEANRQRAATRRRQGTPLLT